MFIVIDALRADRLGCYGHPGGFSPTMDEVAAESVVFDQTIAQAPWTQPSIASLFCSRYPTIHKINNVQLARNKSTGRGRKVAIFGDVFITLAEALRDQGYETAGFVENPWLLADYGFAQGFEHFDDRLTGNYTPGDILNKDLLSWLKKRNTGKPFFAYIYYMDVPDPYYSRAEFYEPLFKLAEENPKKRELSSREKYTLDYLLRGRAAHIINIYKKISDHLEFWPIFYSAGFVKWSNI